MALKLPSYNMFNVATSESETPTSTCLLLFVFILCSLHLIPYKESNNKKLNIINCSCQSQLPGGYHVEVFHFHSSPVNVEEPFHIILSVGHSQLQDKAHPKAIWMSCTPAAIMPHQDSYGPFQLSCGVCWRTIYVRPQPLT